MIALTVLLRMPFKGCFTNSFHQTLLWRSEHQHGVSRSLTKDEETLFSVEGRDENRPHAFGLFRVLIFEAEPAARFWMPVVRLARHS